MRRISKTNTPVESGINAKKGRKKQAARSWLPLVAAKTFFRPERTFEDVRRPSRTTQCLHGQCTEAALVESETAQLATAESYTGGMPGNPTGIRHELSATSTRRGLLNANFRCHAVFRPVRFISCTSDLSGSLQAYGSAARRASRFVFCRQT